MAWDCYCFFTYVLVLLTCCADLFVVDIGAVSLHCSFVVDGGAENINNDHRNWQHLEISVRLQNHAHMETMMNTCNAKLLP
jgi:hypothetical protein